MLFVAINNIPGSIIVVDPDTGSEIKSFSYDSGGFLALESAENILFGIYVDLNSDGFERYTLVTIDQETGATSPVVLSSTTVPLIKTLAYHPVEKVLYGANGDYLIKFDLTSSPGEIQKIGSPGLGEIVALDFSHENVLYCVENLGTLYRIPDPTLTGEQPVKVGPVTTASEVAALASAPSKAPVSGLTFVVGEPPAVDPIKTICSSSFTAPTSTGFEPANSKLKRFRLKRNPLHRGIGLFKFQGTAQEILSLRVYPEDSEPAEAEENLASRWLKKLKNFFQKCKKQDRVFVGIRDAIPGVKFRAKNKGTLPLEMEVEPLPEDGWYYIMVIRPLPRFQNVDYCISLESDLEVSQAWQTLDVVWPGDDSEEESTTVSADAKVPEPVSVAPDSSTVESVDEGSSEDGAEAVDVTTVDQSAGVTPEQSPTKSLMNPDDEGDSEEEPEAAEGTTVDQSAGVTPEQSPTESLMNPDDEGDSEEEPEAVDGATIGVVEEEPPETLTSS
jgi:hypothetical protein